MAEFLRKELKEDVAIGAPVETLSSLPSKVLYYPCSGADFELPVIQFASVIDVFWFVDKAYFSPDHCDTRHFGLDRPADEVSPLFKHPDFEYLRYELRGRPTFPCYRTNIAPCVLTEYYFHIPTQRTIQLKFRRGYGFTGFKVELNDLAVFFHRGDSMGEGGSGGHWYSRKPKDQIWTKLVDGGWLVTDFSLAGPQEVLGKLMDDINDLKYTQVSELLDPPFQAYSPKDNITFTCLGYLGKRYGPTMVFRINHGDITGGADKKEAAKTS